MSKVARKHEQFVSWLNNKVPVSQTTIDRSTLMSLATQDGMKIPAWFTQLPNRAERGAYKIPGRLLTQGDITLVEKKDIPEAVSPVQQENLIPEINPEFVEFGAYQDIKKIIQSRLWFPVYITGHSGCGKTESIRQACAELGREFIRINITSETDADSLLGGLRLDNGRTYFEYGWIVEAMKRGAIVVCDEWDMGSPGNLSCLQAVMEGKSAYIEKTKERIAPAPGFNVFATGNTRGRTDTTGRYAGTRAQNESMLERFDMTIAQDYPSVEVETAILRKRFVSLGLDPKEHTKFITNLALFAEATRKTFRESDGAGDLITTRRLLGISKAFAVFRDPFKAVDSAISRFDDMTYHAFSDLFAAFHAKDTKVAEPTEEPEKPISFDAADLTKVVPF
jgi:hypothetical protein